MLPYLAMFSVPASLALTGARRSIMLLLLVAAFYWLAIGFRFHVGMDWNNYVYLFSVARSQSFSGALFNLEPGFQLLVWAVHRLGGTMVWVNAAAALVFCWGFFAFARRCREPYLAILIATPLLVVAFAMSGTRQAMAIGIISYLFATWDRTNPLVRAGIVLFAGLFHFSAIFALIFVALAARVAPVVRAGATLVIIVTIVAIVVLWPSAIEAYSRLYVGGSQQLRAPGAVVQTGSIALAAFAYLMTLKTWRRIDGDRPLFFNLAVAAVLAVPAAYFSSVGAYRFALYLWPLAMYVGSGFPALIERRVLRQIYRVAMVTGSAAMLAGWLTFANNSSAWFPYKNWLLTPQDAPIRAPSTR